MVPWRWNLNWRALVHSSVKANPKPKSALLKRNPAVRRPRAADFQSLLGLIREYYRYDGLHFDANSIAPALRKLLRDESLGRVWMIHQDGDAVGYVILTFNYDLEFGGLQGIVTDLFLRKKYRGRGLGKQALDCVEEYCRRRGVSAIELQVEQDNKAAHAFYRNLGFKVLTRIVMGKNL
jgi:GNAT superfamily N-acetyltransferase